MFILYSTELLKVRPEDSYAYYVRGIANQNINNVEMVIRDLEKTKSLGNEEADAVILNLINLIPLPHENLGRHLNGLTQLCHDL